MFPIQFKRQFSMFILWLSFLFLGLFLLVACGQRSEQEPHVVTPTPTTMPTDTAVSKTNALPFVPGELTMHKLVVNGLEREYGIYVPTAVAKTDPMPLIINLHGSGATILQHEFLTDMSAKAEEKGFILLYPVARIDLWGNWYLKADPERDEDVAFIRQLVQTVQTTLPIDSRRIYATGASMGGGMANRLGCDAADLFAAVAPVAAVYTDYAHCSPSEPIAFLAIHGTEDDGAYFYGRDDLQLPSVGGLAQAWAITNGCRSQPVETEWEPLVTEVKWSECERDVTVMLYALEGYGHGWPNPNVLPSQVDDFTFDATDVIVEFLMGHPK
ncbi:MAG: hypothetical protein GY796_12005 [Chloroflexi bacterium]|nr:hypothetical protein [Chloroflexota bacterium]